MRTIQRAILHDMVHRIISCPHLHTYSTHTLTIIQKPSKQASTLFTTTNCTLFHLLPFTSPYHTNVGIILLLMWGHHSSTHPFSFLHIFLPYSSFLSRSLLRPFTNTQVCLCQTALSIVCPGRSLFYASSESESETERKDTNEFPDGHVTKKKVTHNTVRS